MEYFARGIIFRQWLLTVLLGSIIYALMHGREAGGRLYSTFTVLEKMRPFGVCLLVALFFSFVGGIAALILNQLVKWSLSPDKIENNKQILLLLPPIVSTIAYCAFFPLFAPSSYKEMPYLSLAWQTAEFLLPWTLSALLIAAIPNYVFKK